MRSKQYESYVHFYIDDYQFERIWNQPKKYISLLSKFKGIIMPDFSIYYDMPIHMKRWNIYRNKFIAAYMQKQGINVIPNIQIMDVDLWNDAISGIETNGVIAVNCGGVKRRYFARQMLNRQIEYICSVINPIKVICYGSDSAIHNIDNAIYFKNNHIERIRNVQRNRIATKL